MRKILVLLPLCLAVISGCSKAPKGEAAKDATSQSQSVAAVEPCPDDGPRLPGSGVCQGRAVNYLNFDAGPRPEAPEGCEWIVNETELAGGEYLLYLAAKCADKVTKLDYAGGAHMAVLSYDTTAIGGEEMKGTEVAYILSAEPDPKTAILNHAREVMDNKAEAAKCSVRPANIEGWPADAFVVDVSAAEAAKFPKDEVRSACGKYGLDEDSQRFWRAFGGFTWFFELGQDVPLVDAGSFTIYTPNSAG